MTDTWITKWNHLQHWTWIRNEYVKSNLSLTLKWKYIGQIRTYIQIYAFPKPWIMEESLLTYLIQNIVFQGMYGGLQKEFLMKETRYNLKFICSQQIWSQKIIRLWSLETMSLCTYKGGVRYKMINNTSILKTLVRKSR